MLLLPNIFSRNYFCAMTIAFASYLDLTACGSSSIILCWDYFIYSDELYLINLNYLIFQWNKTLIGVLPQRLLHSLLNNYKNLITNKQAHPIILVLRWETQTISIPRWCSKGGIKFILSYIISLIQCQTFLMSHRKKGKRMTHLTILVNNLWRKKYQPQREKMWVPLWHRSPDHRERSSGGHTRN